MRPGQHRETARVLLHDDRRNVFLLLTHFDPEVGLPPRWITPGGGIDEGETPVEAAVRELAEETGLIVAAHQLGEPVWVTHGRWDWGDGHNFHTYTDYFFQLDITSLGLISGAGEGVRVENGPEQAPKVFRLDQTNWTDDERRDVLDFGWWNVDALEQTIDSVGPHGLATWLRSWPLST